MGNVDELIQAQAIAARIACEEIEGSRSRLLARVCAGDGKGTAREVEHHLGVLHCVGPMARRPTAKAEANRAWVRNTLRRKDPKFAELLDRVFTEVADRGIVLLPA